MPRKAPDYVQEELEAWKKLAVEGHFKESRPWYSYHENFCKPMSHIVGAQEEEVVVMNSLTVNLHLLMVSFYRPNSKRFKILIEKNAFPSDLYAVKSQARFHGFDPEEAVIELEPDQGEFLISQEQILSSIETHKDSLALILLGNCNYLSGQSFPVSTIVDKAKEWGILVGLDLAHGAGNLYLELHNWNVDFAAWCSYKYLNSGPGNLSGVFIHKKHLGEPLPRFEGWWGTDKKSRFQMKPQFEDMLTAESWQLSNPPILDLAAMRASMEIFEKTSMRQLRDRGDQLTAFLEKGLRVFLKEHIDLITPSNPSERGSMLSLRLKKGNPREFYQQLQKKKVFIDFREPDILRLTPSPLYTSYQEVAQLVQAFKECLQ
ncbi:MAG: kynureninase [Bdellovibrio sp.]|nr:MAG: kynureninase [Bdellovibrio sp.]